MWQILRYLVDMAASKEDWTAKLKAYDEIISLTNLFERKGKTMPYTSANGYMFTLFNKSAEIGVRLSPEAQERFFIQHNSGPYYSYGAKMKDYVLVPEVLWSNKALMKSLIEESYHYVMTLPPK